MGKRAFVIAGDHAEAIANDVTDFRYRATRHELAVGVQVPACCRETVETQFLVEDGLVEFMVGGAAGIVLPGDFVRVRAGQPFAYRNAGEATASVLVRTVSPCATRRLLAPFAA